VKVVDYAPPLLKWFDRNQRDLPWRRNQTPYRVWISEIMLQQTQVKTVVNYYRRFLKRFPTVQSLAEANEAEVMQLWEGLGYYRRARQLHAAAKVIVQDHGGEFPTEFVQALRLPGIGRYTAGAILSIAMDQRLPILEGNTIRLYSRLFALRTDPRLPINQKKLWEFAESILPEKRVGDFNQALMELGSEICKPKEPTCPQCPLMAICPTFAQGLQQRIPAAGKRINYESVTEAIVLLKRNEKFLIRQCQSGGRWDGLFDFPRFRLEGGLNFAQRNQTEPNEDSQVLQEQVKRQIGLEVELKQLEWQRKHAVTRYRICLIVFQSLRLSGRLSGKGSNFRWVTLDQLENIPLSVTARELVRWLQDNKQVNRSC
jgi:A/G-specific adenine glycosylase